MVKILELGKSEDISQVIQKIKALKDREVVLDVESGALILNNSANLRLIRKTAEVLGKKIQLKTDDEMGQMLAVKAGMDLYGQKQVKMPKSIRPGRAPRGKFSDIKGAKPLKIQLAAQGQTDSDEDRSDEGDLKAGIQPIVVPNPQGVKIKRPMQKPIQPKMISKMPLGPHVVSDMAIRTDIKPSEAAPRSRFRKYSRVIVLTAVILAVVVFGVAVLLPKAEITVYARSEPITRDLEINVDRSARGIDVSKQIIPGEIITKELNHTQIFQTSGTKLVGEKATGSVVIYNFTKNTLTLKAATTTLLINGKKYFFDKDATGIRPTGRIGTGDEQEVDRSTLTAPIPITAENAGSDYNLPVNQKIQIVNAALGDNPNVYAANEIPFAGGSATTVKILSQADIDRATLQMTEELATIAERDLATDDTQSKKVLTTGSKTEILAKTANKNVGDEAVEFDMTIIGRLTGLSYNEDDIKNLMVEKIMSVLTEDKYLLEDGKKDVSSRYKSVDLATGKGILNVHFETVVAYKVENQNLSESLAGKDASGIKEILLTKPEIDRVDVKFSPFFVKKAPKFNGKIFIETKLSEL